MDAKIRKTKRVTILLLVVALCVPILVLAVPITGLIVSERMSHQPFSADKWASEPAGRVNMVDALLENYPLNGLSEAELVTLLGEKDDTPYFQKKNRYVYYLGPERGPFGIDSEWLIVDFENGVVIDHYLATD